jgi:hypothetical protein
MEVVGVSVGRRSCLLLGSGSGLHPESEALSPFGINAFPVSGNIGTANQNPTGLVVFHDHIILLSCATAQS